MATSPQPLTALIDTTTILSLASTVFLLTTAYALSLRLLPTTTTTRKTRALFIWHAFDALIHFCLEGGYLYNCFFSYTTNSSLWAGKNSVSAYLPPDVYFLGYKDRLYGAEYGTNPLAALWREYAKADKRWGGSDLTVISLEMLTVLVEAPMAVYICYLIVRQRRSAWFWMLVVAVGELYGGWMTFGPEFLSGNPNLDTSNAMYLWVYLVFFNTLWVWIPGWICWESYHNLVGTSGGSGFGKAAGGKSPGKSGKKRR